MASNVLVQISPYTQVLPQRLVASLSAQSQLDDGKHALVRLQLVSDAGRNGMGVWGPGTEGETRENDSGATEDA